MRRGAPGRLPRVCVTGYLASVGVVGLRWDGVGGPAGVRYRVVVAVAVPVLVGPVGLVTGFFGGAFVVVVLVVVLVLALTLVTVVTTEPSDLVTTTVSSSRPPSS